MTENRHKIQQWCMTFPQCGDVTKQVFADSLPPIKVGYFATEEHEDGGLHIHTSFKLKNAIYKKAMLKWLTVKWPNDWKRIQFEATKYLGAWEDYVGKEDPSPLVIGTKEKKTVEDKFYEDKDGFLCCAKDHMRFEVLYSDIFPEKYIEEFYKQKFGIDTEKKLDFQFEVKREYGPVKVTLDQVKTLYEAWTHRWAPEQRLTERIKTLKDIRKMAKSPICSRISRAVRARLHENKSRQKHL